jgi:hypothetical protein
MVLFAGATDALGNDADAGSSVYASIYAYFPADDRDYLQPTLILDRDWLHLEARYNYEDFDTGSAWAGYNLSGGETLAWEITPMLGVVLGDTRGIAPGYEGSLAWHSLEFYSEGEYVFDRDAKSDRFFYNWSELSLAMTQWLRFGLVTQRTQVYNSERDLQRGLLLGLSFEQLGLTTYVFNPDDSGATIVVAIEWAFD